MALRCLPALTFAVLLAAPTTAGATEVNRAYDNTGDVYHDLPPPVTPKVNPGPPGGPTRFGQGSRQHHAGSDHAWGSHMFVLGGSVRTHKPRTLKAK